MSTSTAADRPTVVLRVLFITAVALSVLHYLDNWLRFDAYALNPASPIQSAWIIPVAWLAFTVIGIAGFVQYGRSRWWPAVALLGIYSLSGLIGAVHYTDAPPTDFDAVQNLLIVTDILAGIGVLGFAIWLMRTRALPAMHTERPAPSPEVPDRIQG